MGMPKPGTKKYEELIGYMRYELENGFPHEKLIQAAKKLLESQGKNFEEEFEKWKNCKNREPLRREWEQTPVKIRAKTLTLLEQGYTASAAIYYRDNTGSSLERACVICRWVRSSYEIDYD